MKIAVTTTSFSMNETLRNELMEIFPDCKFNDSGKKLAGKELIDFLDGTDGVIVGLEKIDTGVIDSLPKLKIVSKYGVGRDNIDLKYCRERKIVVGWTPGVNRIAVAEMALGFMIMLGRNLFKTSVQLKNGVWNKDGGFDLHGKTVGIIGVGNIGKEVVRLLKPFECNIMVNDIVDQAIYYKEHDLVESSKNEIYRMADFITIHTPLTDLTTNLINRDVLSMMKRNAYLINAARGPIVNSLDLKWALKNKIIAGAALDVYEQEPPEDNELLGLENVICTPHIGGNSHEAVLLMGRSAIKHLRDYFSI